MLSREIIAVAAVKSIESRVADRGFWLSAAAGLARGDSEWVWWKGVDGA
jgi:hypothetical protein